MIELNQGRGIGLSGSQALVATVLLANSPQLVLTFLYFAYNGLFTCMLLAQEWNGYSLTRKPLRVTSPASQQRGTYFLQLPYRISVPLLIGSGLLHWLVSQSIFLARVSVLDAAGSSDPVWVDESHFFSDDDGKSVLKEISTCGYSPIAIVFVIALGSIVMLVGAINGLRRLKVGVPLAGSCSAAISAACHPPQGDLNQSLKPVMWGAVTKEDSETINIDVGHCSFTSFEVEPPTRGQWYAGY